jgi:hypothetical protein
MATAKGGQVLGVRGGAGRTKRLACPAQSRPGKRLTTVSQTDGTVPDPAASTRHAADPDLRIWTLAHWLDASH